MKFIIAIVFSLLSLNLNPPKLIKGKVVSIADGDTFTILTEDKEQVKIRLYGVDCPEKKQDFGTKAKQFTSNLCFGKVVNAQVKNNDRYGRKIALVILPDGRIVNKELLTAGMAWHYKHYDKSEEFALLELKAKKSKIGIWSAPNPVAPWDFRKDGKTAKTSNYKKKIVQRCSGTTAAGSPCKHNATQGGRCWQHRM